MPASDLAGRFIVLDGGEGCGKSTQMKRLASGFSVVEPLVLRDPGTTATGERIRDLLLDPQSNVAMRSEMLLYMAARAQLVQELVRPAIDSGRLVLCDRFVSSTLAYQLGGDGLTFDEIEQTASVATGGCLPDLTIILDVPTEVAQARVVPKYRSLFGDASADGDKDRIERRPESYHRQVRQNFLDLAERRPERHAVVDASATVDVVAERVRAAIAERLSG